MVTWVQIVEKILIRIYIRPIYKCGVLENEYRLRIISIIACNGPELSWTHTTSLATRYEEKRACPWKMLEEWLLIASILMPLKAMNSKNISVKARHVGGDPPGVREMPTRAYNDMKCLPRWC